jgi:hypothetical protein
MNYQQYVGNGRKMSLLQNRMDPLAGSEIEKLIRWLPRHSTEGRPNIEVSVDSDISRLLKQVKLEALLPLARLMFLSRGIFPNSFVQDIDPKPMKKVQNVVEAEKQPLIADLEEEISLEEDVGNIDEGKAEKQPSSVPLDNILRDKQRLRVLLNTSIRVLNPNEIFVEKERPCDYVYFMLRGQVAALSCTLRTKRHPDGYPVIEQFDDKYIVRKYDKGHIVADLESVYNDRR